jgi:hypothetical protein
MTDDGKGSATIAVPSHRRDPSAGRGARDRNRAKR